MIELVHPSRKVAIDFVTSTIEVDLPPLLPHEMGSYIHKEVSAAAWRSELEPGDFIFTQVTKMVLPTLPLGTNVVTLIGGWSLGSETASSLREAGWMLVEGELGLSSWIYSSD